MIEARARIGMQQLIDAVSWRWQRATRLRYLRKTFVNGDDLAASYVARTPCDTAVCRDGTTIRHPVGRSGLAGMILEVWFDEVYLGDFYSPRDGDVVVDAGANIGLFSLQVARRNPSCRVLAFEPFSENFDLLTQNLSSVQRSVQMLPVALSGRSGTARMMDGGHRSQDHRLSVSGDADAGGGIRTLSFEGLLELCGGKPIAMFKCDIEGSEHDLFSEVSSQHLARVDRFAIEYHDNIRHGTLELLQARLEPSYTVRVEPASDGAYGMLYATAKRLG